MNKENPYAAQEEVPYVAFEDGLSSIMLRKQADVIEYLAPNGMFP